MNRRVDPQLLAIYLPVLKLQGHLQTNITKQIILKILYSGSYTLVDQPIVNNTTAVLHSDKRPPILNEREIKINFTFR